MCWPAGRGEGEVKGVEKAAERFEHGEVVIHSDVFFRNPSCQ